MILLKRSLTHLAVAYRHICEFNRNLEHTWIPGFYRSYERRQAAYLKAIHRYEERSMLIRLLFRTPKPPGRPSPGLRDEVAGRLWHDWLASLSSSLYDGEAGDRSGDSAEDSAIGHLVYALGESMDDNFYALTNLQTTYEKTPLTVVIGPSGGWIVSARQDDWTQLDFKPLPGLYLKRNPEFHSIDAEKSEHDAFDQLAVFQIIDDFLTYHHNQIDDDTVSALKVAEHLINQEKDNLLKLAATL